VSTASAAVSAVRQEAIDHAVAMVCRYEQAVGTHPPAGDPLSQEQQAEVANLMHWRRRLTRITRSASGARRSAD